jgi:hypothetical protein
MKNHHLIIKISLFLFIAFCSLSPVSRVYSEEKVKKVHIKDTSPSISTPKYSTATDAFHPSLGTYRFSVKWGKVNAGKASIEVSREQDLYNIHVKAKTQNTVNKFYKLRFRGETQLSANNLAPIKTKMYQRTNDRAKEVEITFHDEGEIESVRHKYKDKIKKKTEIRKLNTENFTLDPVSAVFIVRSLDWGKGVSRVFDVFDGKSRHLITITCEGKQKKDVLGETRETWVLLPTIQNITKDEDSSEVGTIRIYLSTDKAKEILIIEGDIMVGKIITKLESFTPLKAVAPSQDPVKNGEPKEVK